MMAEVCALLKIKKIQTTPYRPSSNGGSEHFNQSIIQILNKYCSYDQLDWDLHVRSCVYSYNTSPLTNTIGYTPFYMLFCRECRSPADSDVFLEEFASRDQYQHISEFILTLEKAHTAERDRLRKHQDCMKSHYDKQIHETPLAVGGIVYLFCPAVPKGKCSKLYKKWQGPFKMCAKIGPVNCRLRWLIPINCSSQLSMQVD